VKRLSRALGLVTVAALIATSSVTAIAAAAAPKPVDMLPGIAESDQLTGPILAHGLLMDTRGRPASGQVTVIAWPRQEVMDALRVGDAVKTAPVGKASVAADGRFALRVDPKLPLNEYMSQDGSVSFDLWGVTADGSTLFSFTRKLDAGVKPAWVDPQGLRSSGAIAPETVDVTLRAAAGSVDMQDAASVPAPASDKACVDTVVATYNGRVGVIGEVYSGPHSTADFQYANGSGSTLGVAFDSPGLPVNFSASGTTGISSSGTIDYPTQAANKLTVFETTFGYQNIKRQIYGSAGCIQQGNQVRPYRWDGAVLSYTAAAAPSVIDCQPVSIVPSTLTKDKANAITFSNGLKISSVLGIDLSLKTGFNTSTRIIHRFTSVGSLCGSDASWPNASRIVGR
jgi:hypothetical protein